MVFRAVYSATPKFKYIAQTLVKVADTIPFLATPDGIVVRTLSPDKTTMISLSLPAIAFDEYECDSEEGFLVSSDEFNRIIKRGTRNDILEMILEREYRRLRIVFRDKKTGVIRTFNVQLREGSVEKLSEPKIELSATIRMLASDFKNLVRDAKIVGDEIEFITTKDKFIAVTETQQRVYRCVMELDRPLISLIVKKDEVRSTYGIELLEATLKAAMAANTLTLEYGENLPVKVEFDVPGGGLLTYWVAPRAK